MDDGIKCIFTERAVPMFTEGVMQNGRKLTDVGNRWFPILVKFCVFCALKENALQKMTLKNTKNRRKPCGFDGFLAPQKEFESPTFRLGGGCSIQLSYWGVYAWEKRSFTELSLTQRMLSKWLRASLRSVAICTPPAGGVSCRAAGAYPLYSNE